MTYSLCLKVRYNDFQSACAIILQNKGVWVQKELCSNCIEEQYIHKEKSLNVGYQRQKLINVLFYQNFLRGGGGGGVQAYHFGKMDFELGVGGKARTRPNILRVHLDPYVQYCPCEASEQKQKTEIKKIEFIFCHHSICL